MLTLCVLTFKTFFQGSHCFLRLLYTLSFLIKSQNKESDEPCFPWTVVLCCVTGEVNREWCIWGEGGEHLIERVSLWRWDNIFVEVWTIEFLLESTVQITDFVLVLEWVLLFVFCFLLFYFLLFLVFICFCILYFVFYFYFYF